MPRQRGVESPWLGYGAGGGGVEWAAQWVQQAQPPAKPCCVLIASEGKLRQRRCRGSPGALLAPSSVTSGGEGGDGHRHRSCAGVSAGG